MANNFSYSLASKQIDNELQRLIMLGKKQISFDSSSVPATTASCIHSLAAAARLNDKNIHHAKSKLLFLVIRFFCNAAVPQIQTVQFSKHIN